jgi:putative acetyltransferase
MTSINSIVISEARPDASDALKLLAELDAELQAQPYPAESRHAFSVEKLLRENVAFFVARFDGEPAGCGGMKLFGTEYGEVKRMYVRPHNRGQGIGKAILKHLAEFALQRQTNLLRLETGIYQTEAIGLYERFGFQQSPPFGEYKVDPMSVYLEMALA